MPLFDPTWAGAHEWISHGMRGATPARETSRSQAFPNSQGLSVVGEVKSVAPSAYTIRDGGESVCPGGSPAHVVELRPINDPASHPLRLAVIDSVTGLFCSLKFDVRGSGGLMGTTGSAQINFESLQERWVAIDGRVDTEVRLLGMGVKRTSIDFRRADIAFAP